MPDKHVDYSNNVNSFQCSGKKYNGEKGIISLTSWKARIKTVGKTLYSLIKKCPEFHIVLVLSEEEFQQKEKELPDDLMLIVEHGLIELLWVYKNYKVTKKLIPCCKYTDLPIIITDDDVIIVKSFAEELYQKWYNNKNMFISYTKSYANPPYICAACGLIPPSVNEYIKTQFKEGKMKTYDEDVFLRNYAYTHKINVIGLHDFFPFYFHDETHALNGSENVKKWRSMQRYR